MKEIKLFEQPIEVMTLDGWKKFQGVSKSKHQKYLKFYLTDNIIIDCSHNHRFLTILGWFEASWLVVGDIISGREIIDIVEIDEEIFLYDLIDVDGNHYLTNGVTSHNCIMVSDKGTLINSRKIEAIQTKEPELSLGDLNLFTTDFKNRKIMIACDVSDGIGQDYHAMQLFDVDTLEQIGEYQNNIMSQSYYSKEIIKTITYMFTSGASEVYYTVENNGTGAGVIRLLESASNEYLERAMFVSDVNGNKTGVVMSKKSKEKACALFKDLLEMDKIKLNSERLKVQLKFFVKTGNTFKAESGTNDDLVMACILMMLLMDILVNYEDSVYDAVSEIDSELDDEDWGIVW